MVNPTDLIINFIKNNNKLEVIKTISLVIIAICLIKIAFSY